MLRAMSEERREQAQEEARRVLSPVRVAVLLLLGALFLVVGGSRADAAEAAPASGAGPGLLAGTLSAVDAGPELTAVGGTVDGLVAPVLAAAEPVVAPVVSPVQPVLEPAVAPLQPVVRRVVPPLPALPLPALAVVTEASATPVSHAASGPAVEAPADTAPAAERTEVAPVTRTVSAAQAVASDGPQAPAHQAPATRPASTSTTGGGTGAPVPYAVLLTAFLAVVLLVGGVVPRTSAPPLAPSFLPPVFPG